MPVLLQFPIFFFWGGGGGCFAFSPVLSTWTHAPFYSGWVIDLASKKTFCFLARKNTAIALAVCLESPSCRRGSSVMWHLAGISDVFIHFRIHPTAAIGRRIISKDKWPSSGGIHTFPCHNTASTKFHWYALKHEHFLSPHLSLFCHFRPG